MPLTEAEKTRLVEYIWQRTCGEHRQGEACLDRKGRGLVNGMHPGCREADELIELVRSA